MKDKEARIDAAVAKAVDEFKRTIEGRLTTREKIRNWVVDFNKIGRVYLLLLGVALILLIHDKILGLFLGFFCFYIYDWRVTQEEAHRTFERGQRRYKAEQALKNKD